MLELSGAGRYDEFVAATAVTGISSPNPTRRAAPDWRFFVSGRFLNGGWRGEVLRPAGVLVDRSANPVPIRHPRLAAMWRTPILQGVCFSYEH